MSGLCKHNFAYSAIAKLNDRSTMELGGLLNKYAYICRIQLTKSIALNLLQHEIRRSCLTISLIQSHSMEYIRNRYNFGVRMYFG
ncbi:hypothetical protein D3C78_1293280 [compost metagenome]